MIGQHFVLVILLLLAIFYISDAYFPIYGSSGSDRRFEVFRNLAKLRQNAEKTGYTLKFDDHVVYV